MLEQTTMLLALLCLVMLFTAREFTGVRSPVSGTGTETRGYVSCGLISLHLVDRRYSVRCSEHLPLGLSCLVGAWD